ncbi:uncharacterized protein F5147DRAFT_134989 [Suillus discolor]|uniref:TFIIF beta subunit HTH domain-containing protein n=1 Tax=Suillus discolor TaxID=1912936 RepID=A0A9P7JV72_9AGAM|nr:uncharacterized protein F5147DRAFT_134989 [Suillus discolor]KAG2110273.1 hypothetical protein F5147DRAFT_134989 [Suillus discolor]
MAHMPCNQLLDLIFTSSFASNWWSIKPLCEYTQRPDACLKEVLLAITSLNRSGEYNGMLEFQFSQDLFFRSEGSNLDQVLFQKESPVIWGWMNMTRTKTKTRMTTWRKFKIFVSQISLTAFF